MSKSEEELKDEFYGREAYSAYCETTDWKSAVTGAKLPDFKETNELVQKAWINSAKHVLNLKSKLNFQ